MEANQQFNLRWNNHTNNILQVFLEHLASESLVDVTLSCQGQFIKAHRMILSACSPYFQELFKHHTAKHPVIILNGINFLDLQMMIKFMYNGEIRVQETQLDGLLAAAETLQVKGLSNVRHKYEKGEIHSQKTEKSMIVSEKHTSIDTKKSIGVENGGGNNDTKPSAPQGNPPRIRKRKMSHTVNDLAKETVFATTELTLPGPESSTTNPPKLQDNPRILNFYNEEYLECQSSRENKGTGAKKRPAVLGRKATTIVTDQEQTTASKIPRPPNAFMIFANEWRRKMADDNPDCNNKEISVRLGVMWKELDAGAKDAYYASARKVDEDHKRRYPNYYYSPKEARLRKSLKQDMMLAKCSPSSTKDPNILRFIRNIDDEVDNGSNKTTDEIMQTNDDNNVSLSSVSP